MTRLEKVIEQVKNARRGDENHRPWIFDENGNIKKDVICGEVLEFLEECKYYELSEDELSDEEMEQIQKDENLEAYNTYNNGANISNDIQYYIKEIDDGYIFVMMIHLYGDIRGGYSDLFAIKTEDEMGILYFDSIMQCKEIDDRYIADINILSECYDVFDYENGNDVDGTFFELETKDVLKKLKRFKVYRID